MSKDSPWDLPYDAATDFALEGDPHTLLDRAEKAEARRDQIMLDDGP